MCGDCRSLFTKRATHYSRHRTFRLASRHVTRWSLLNRQFTTSTTYPGLLSKIHFSLQASRFPQSEERGLRGLALAPWRRPLPLPLLRGYFTELPCRILTYFYTVRPETFAKMSNRARADSRETHLATRNTIVYLTRLGPQLVLSSDVQARTPQRNRARAGTLRIRPQPGSTPSHLRRPTRQSLHVTQGSLRASVNVPLFARHVFGM